MSSILQIDSKDSRRAACSQVPRYRLRTLRLLAHARRLLFPGYDLKRLGNQAEKALEICEKTGCK